MRFFHISDLHFGKLLYGYDLTEEHRNFIEQLGDYCDKYNPDAVLIAGDVYDRSVPSADAMTLLDELLNKLHHWRIEVNATMPTKNPLCTTCKQ